MTCPSHVRFSRVLFRCFSLRRAVLLLPAMGLFVLAASCDGFFVSESSIQSVTVTPPGVLLKAGASPADTFSLSSAAVTVGGTSSNDTTTADWSSSDTAVVTVGKGTTGGMLTAVGTTGGQTATITATDGGVKGTSVVRLYITAPTTLAIGFPGNIVPSSVAAGQTFQVTALAVLDGNPAPQNISALVTWSLNNNAAGATINQSGIVTIPSTALGSFTVVATVQLGSAASPAIIPGSLTFTV